MYSFNALRRLFGLGQFQQLADSPAAEAQFQASSFSRQPPYNGVAVPREASQDPDDSDVYAIFDSGSQYGSYVVVPSKDGTSVLVFSSYFMSESHQEKGVTILYRDWEIWPDEDYHEERLDFANKMYQHLFRDRQPHPRVVRYMGSTPSGYRLERLFPGAVDFTRSSSSDAVLALQQRWAIQVLSALQWLHDRRVTLQDGSLQQEAMWLRPDYSIALAGFVTAGCFDLEIQAHSWGSCHFRNPWSPHGQQNPPLDSWEEIGVPKGDLSHWASWVYDLMTANGDPLEHDLNQLDFEEHRRREEQAMAGEFENWPRLSKDMLGPVLIKAWRGEYQCANEALQDSRNILKQCGRTLSDDKVDEIDGFDWNSLSKVGRDKYGGKELQLRSDSVDECSDPVNCEHG